MLNSRIRQEEDCLDDFFFGEDEVDEFGLVEEKKRKPGRPKKVVEKIDVRKEMTRLDEAIERVEKL